jgi:preprotein translocase subunit SecD
MSKISDIQRIATILKIKGDDEHLILKIQDVLKSNEKKYKKQDFSYALLKAQNDRLKKEINNLHNEYAESIGIHEHIIVKQSRDTIKKELNKVLIENHRLNETIRRYQEREFNDKLNKIVNG